MDGRPMRLTVAICTWNRADLLREGLRQFERLVVPPGVEWELIVVDNNSTDHTADVVKAAAERLPIRYCFEPQSGKSYALNRATAEAKGEYILWTDDDTLVDEQWMVEYLAAFRRRPEAAVFGGRIEPWFAGTPPAWLPRVFRHVASAYAALDLGDVPVPLTKRLVPFGANMAVRTADQRRFPYDPTLGPRAGSAVRGEEVEVVIRMLDAGLAGCWVPAARVKHFIPAHRQTIAYLRGYYFGQGQVRSVQRPAKPPAMLWGRPRWLWRRAVEAELAYRIGRLFLPPERWIEALVEASTCWGHIRGLPAQDRRSS